MKANENSEHEDRSIKNPSRKLTRLYLIALSSIALLAIVGQIIIQYSLQKQQEDSYIINMAGRQRMLSQKITKLSLLIADTKFKNSSNPYLNELKETLNKWTIFHYGLQYGNQQIELNHENSIEVKILFDKIQPYFIAIEKNTNAILEKKNSIEDQRDISDFVSNILENEGRFLKGMDNIVQQYQKEAIAKVTFVKRLEISLFVLLLIVLVLEGIFIFKPFANKIQSTVSLLNQTKEELRKNNLALEAKVQQRTEDLHKKNLELAELNKVLHKKNSDLDTFVYTASHDLKAPIHNIEGLINQLSEESEEKDKFLIDLIKESIEKFKSVIKDLAETGKKQAIDNSVSSRIQFKEIVNEIKFSIKDLIISSGAIINENYEAAPEIFYSKKNIRSILYNLISNAIKYRNPEKSIEIVLSTKSLHEYILLEVKDNGIGIQESDKQKIFSMYERLVSPKEGYEKIEGTGVGLAIVAKILENDGGKIEIESTPGEGSNFKVYLKKGDLIA